MPFRNAKALTIELSDYGSYLGRAEGCFEVRNKNGQIDRYPHFQKEIGEAVLKSGSYVSVDALIDLALWNIDTLSARAVEKRLSSIERLHKQHVRRLWMSTGLHISAEIFFCLITQCKSLNISFIRRSTHN